MAQRQPLPMNSDEAIERGLDATTIAIVGLSADPDSASYPVAEYLQRQGYRIIPVNPREQEILGQRSYPSLRDVPEPIDVVDVFRKPAALPEVVEDAIAIGAPLIWMQRGVVNPDAAQRAQEAGLTVVMDRCMKVEHRMRRT